MRVENKKIAIILPSFGLIGAQRTAIDNGKQLLNNGYDVYWIASEEGEMSLELENARAIVLDGSIFKKVRGIRIIISLLRILKYINQNNFDVVISIAPFLNRVMCFFKFTHLLDTLLIIEDHAYPPRSYQDEFTFFWKQFYLKTEWLYNSADKIRVLSFECKNYYIKKIKVKSKVIVFHNLMDFDRIEKLSTRKNEFNTKVRPRLVYVGRFARQKNISFLIKAFEKLRMVINCEMFIIGYGPEEMLLKDLINDLNLQKDIFLIPSSIDNYSILKSADVFPIASIWEGMVLTMIEAMFLGIPVVSTNFLCGPTFLIGQENDRGWLVEENNLDLYHIALIEAIQNKNLANEKSKNAKKFVDENLSIDKQFRNYIDNFIEI